MTTGRQTASGDVRYVEVAVPVPVGHRFHYTVPPGFQGRVHVGTRVLARFGARKLTGVVVRMDTPPPEGVMVAGQVDGFPRGQAGRSGDEFHHTSGLAHAGGLGKGEADEPRPLAPTGIARGGGCRSAERGFRRR